jgi:EpsI family protein
MMISRRNLLIGAGCLAAAGGAAALTPRRQMSLVNGAKFEDAIPLEFAGWTKRDTNALVVPESENSLSAQLYSEVLGRLYTRGEDDYVMMLIAYGDTQNDLLQLHRPEVCYPAFGFEVTQSNRTDIALGNGVSVPGRALSATSPGRTEHITYWTRIGEYLPADGNEQRMMKLQSEFAGIVPDGVLVRISSAVQEPADAFALNQAFAADLVAATKASMKPALIGTEKTRELARSRA